MIIDFKKYLEKNRLKKKRILKAKNNREDLIEALYRAEKIGDDQGAHDILMALQEVIAKERGLWLGDEPRSLILLILW